MTSSGEEINLKAAGQDTWLSGFKVLMSVMHWWLSCASGSQSHFSGKTADEKNLLTFCFWPENVNFGNMQQTTGDFLAQK